MGWDVVNHSYWHTGNHWDKSQFLKPEDFRRELFWSQMFLRRHRCRQRAACATHFVYPNGDYHYQDYLKEFGLRSASRVSGSSPRNLLDAQWNPLDLNRNYLDTEGVWAAQKNALAGLPERAAKLGDFVLDFTHGMNGDTANSVKITQDYGKRDWRITWPRVTARKGDNSVWVAPSDQVVNYRLAAPLARVSIAPGLITVTLPDDAPGSALTLKLSELGAQTQLPAPAGTTLFRQQDVAWLTTPLIGEIGGAPLSPQLRMIYSGPVKDLNWGRTGKNRRSALAAKRAGRARLCFQNGSRNARRPNRSDCARRHQNRRRVGPLAFVPDRARPRCGDGARPESDARP